jgi:hypothetical protein
MYATEGLGKFSVFGEKPLSVSMASTNFLRNPVLIRPPTWATSHTNHCNTRIISGRVPVPTMLTCRCSVDAKSVGGDVFSVTSSSKSDVDYLGQSTKGDLNLKLDRLEAFGKTIHFMSFWFFCSVFFVFLACLYCLFGCSIAKHFKFEDFFVFCQLASFLFL